jgi:hypothetical protein
MERTMTSSADELGPGDQLCHLAWDLATGGFEGHEVSVREVVRSSRAAGVSPVLVGILADPTEPEVARLRAFGRVAATLAASPLATGEHVHVTAA